MDECAMCIHSGPEEQALCQKVFFFNLEFVLQFRNELFAKSIEGRGEERKKAQLSWIKGKKKKSMPTEDPCSRSSPINK